MDIETAFSKLIEEIEAAGLIARQYFEDDNTENEQKQDGSVVTAVDQGIERLLRTFVDKHFPDDAIVGEEEDNKAGTSGFVWHIDPIDGTDNFLRKIPFCAVSVARLGDTAEDSFGIVHNPLTGQTFASLMEDGVYENKRVRQMSAEGLGGRYITAIGRGREPWMRPAMFRLLEALTNKYGGAKTYGSTALELAYVAAGRIDSFLTFGLNTYDYAAGLYLARAAGGQISVFEDGRWQTWERSLKELCDHHGKTIFVSHPAVHEEMRSFIGDPKSWAAGA